MASHGAVRYYCRAAFASPRDNCTAAFRRALGVALQLVDMGHQALDAGQSALVEPEQRAFGTPPSILAYSRVVLWTPAQGRGDRR